MATRTLLLLTLVLLGSPGLAFSGLSSEYPSLSDGVQLFPGLAPEGPQVNLLTTREGQGIKCQLCLKGIRKLENMVGKQPDENTITKAVSRTCGKVKPLLRGLCKSMKKYLQHIARDTMDKEKPHAVCVDMCISQAGLM